MTAVERARRALMRADGSGGEIERSLWLALAADYAIKRRAVLVGGAAVNLHTGSYRPTAVDMCAYLDVADRESMRAVGFENLQGDHFAYTFGDGEHWLIGFPDSQVDGDVEEVVLDRENVLTVISLESLIVDRILQATDGTTVTFDEAVRLCVAVLGSADWMVVEDDIRKRDQLQPTLESIKTYQRVVATAQELLEG